MWLWLVLVAVSGGWAAPCPESCFCEEQHELLVGECSSPPSSGNKLEALTLSRFTDTPMELTDGQFASSRHLKYLTLRNSSIYYIHKKAFYGAKSLIEIDLSFNYLEEFEPTVFQHLKNLTTLSLRGNLIHFVSEKPFLVSNSLQHLDIGQCKLRNVPREVFYGLRRLQYLSMDSNFLKTLKYNSLPKNLKYLNLSKNLIVNVPTEVISALTNLRKIGLGDNPINCSCSLLNLQDWLSGRGVIFEDSVICASPVEYYGISWSKVDEKRLCLDEVRKEQESYSSFDYPLAKNRLGLYRDLDNSYLKDSLQADQPHSPELQAEVLFQNDETIAMGELMRNKEDLKDKKEELETTHGEDMAKTQEELESKEYKTEESEKLLGEVNPDNSEPEKIEKGTTSSSDEAQILNSNLENIDNNAYETGSESENLINEESENVELQHVRDDQDIIETEIKSTSSPMKEKEIQDEEVNGSGAGELDLEPIQVTHDSDRVEFITEADANNEVDDLKKEGFIQAKSERIVIPPVDIMPIEGTTDFPDVDSTMKIDEGTTTTEEPFPETAENKSSELTENFTVTTTEVPVIEFNENQEEIKQIETSESPENWFPEKSITEPTISVTDSGLDENVTIEVLVNNKEEESSNMAAPERESTKNNEDMKIKEVAGAEVVMFCVAILVICLLLFSIYKCRTRSKEPNNRIILDLESNKGTEMQDMASLLPKPEEDGKKNNLKYQDKATSGENVKLLTDQNEIETSNFTPLISTKHKVEDKNSINNNTSNGVTPLIKSDNAVTVSPASPIQRTKVKVCVIPDSIPRTPILIQKSLNGTTKNV